MSEVLVLEASDDGACHELSEVHPRRSQGVPRHVRREVVEDLLVGHEHVAGRHELGVDDRLLDVVVAEEISEVAVTGHELLPFLVAAPGQERAEEDEGRPLSRWPSAATTR